MSGGDEALLAGVVDDLPLGVWIARAPGGDFVFANRTFREIMGMEARPDVAAGDYAAPYGICDRQGQPYPEERMPFVQALRAGKTVTVDDIVIHRTDGRKVEIRATARPVVDAGGETSHVVIAFEDISAEREVERSRIRADARTQEAQRLEALGTLSAGVAHDFNNMLASISLLASRLRVGEQDPSRTADLRHIEGAVDSAAKLTRALLAFGRASPARTQRFDATAVVRGVVDLARRTFDPAVQILFEPRVAAWLLGDPSQIEQACLNLAINARDAMPTGGTIEVVVDVVELANPPLPLDPGPHVVVTVSDTGPGVPAAIRHRIFEPYFTTKQEQARPGTGLGLATVYAVAQSLGGMVELLDASPRGTSFRLTIPGVRGGGAAARSVPPADLVAGSGRVLLVEDEPMMRRATRRLLELLGYDVVEATDGVEALAALGGGSAPFDVVLLDAIMPRMSGRSLLRELAAQHPDLPAVVTSGRLAPGEADELKAAGAVAVLHKPFTAAELSVAIGEARARGADGADGVAVGDEASRPMRR